MFIHLEDWTTPLFLSMVEKKGIPHHNRIIKAFSLPEDPRKYIANTSAFRVYEASGLPFTDEENYHYEDRETYTGKNLEETIQHLALSPQGQEVVRSLFRFAHADIGVIPNVMAQKIEDAWIFDHPFQEIDGLKPGKQFRGDKEAMIHIDIFHPSSLEVLEQVVDLSDHNNFIGYREGQLLRRQVNREGAYSRSKES